jgi:hypothetical protein
MLSSDARSSACVHSVGTGWRTEPGLVHWSIRQEAVPLSQSLWMTGAPWLGVTSGPAAVPVAGRVSIRTAMRISAVSASETAIRCTTPLYGPAIRDAKTARAAALTSARPEPGDSQAPSPGHHASAAPAPAAPRASPRTRHRRRQPAKPHRASITLPGPLRRSMPMARASPVRRGVPTKTPSTPARGLAPPPSTTTHQ